MKSKCLRFGLMAMSVVSSCWGLTYFYMSIDGSPATVQTQGQTQFLLADCAPLGSIAVYYYLDLDSSGTIETGEPLYFAMNFWDNEDEFPPDMDPTPGAMNILWPLHMPPGHYVILGMEGSDAISFPYHVLEPDPLLHSISGRITFEGITPPDPAIVNYIFLIGTMDPPILMYAITDEWGDFYVNWPGDTATVFALFIMEVEGYAIPDMPMFHVDGHSTGFDIEFFLGGGLSDLRMWEDGIESTVHTQGVNYSFTMACAEWGHANLEFYVDTDGDGSIGPDDWNFFDRTWYIEDNMWTDEWYRDIDDDPGEITVSPPFHFPPGNYIVHAYDDMASEQISFTVLAPDPLTHSVSGTVSIETITPPDEMLDRLVVYVSDMWHETIYYAFVDETGAFTCNWASGDMDVNIGIAEPYPSPLWGFSSATSHIYLDGVYSGISLFVPYIAIDDSIHIVFEQDSGLWDIPQREIKAVYLDPVSGAIVAETFFPDSGEIYIPVRLYPCGIVFEGTYSEFIEHNFLSPYDTLWVTPDSFPAEYHLFASQCCYHFKLKLDGFEPDSLPMTGIQYSLYGDGPDGQRYYSRAKMYIQLEGEDYVVSGGRELCPATWTAVLPNPLPAGYIPEVFETTFVIPRVDTWPHMLIAIPVHFDNISEAELPEGLSLNVYPNPFNASVSIDFRSNEPGEVSIEVFDMMGRRVTALNGTIADKGAFRARWDCKDSFGKNVSTGVYLFKINTPTETRIVKGMYLK